MKRILLIAALVLLSAAGGALIAQQYLPAGTADSATGMDTNPPEGAPGHRHVLVKRTDAQGKTYYTCAMHPQVRSDKPGQCPICGMSLIKKTEAAPAEGDAGSPGEKKPLYWYDPMKPDQHFDHPGKSPFMDMQLVPMYGDESGARASNIITIDPRVVQNLGIRTAPVVRQRVQQDLRVPGSLAVNENHIEVVQTRAAGWVERLHVRAMNDTVRKGQVLAEVYAPDLYAAQRDFVLATRAQDAMLTNAARGRLRLLGLNEGAITRLEATGEAQRRVAYTAPVDGIVMELGVRDGAQISPGMSLYTLADLSSIWINAEVPEAQAANLHADGPVEARLPALPGRSFSGRIAAILPEIDTQTRTVRVRAVFDNRSLLLKPGMFAEVSLGKGEAREALTIPSEAVIRTGTRSTVIVAEAEGRFRPVEVRLGAQHDGQTEVLDGLDAGQKVVASGQFLIDSEANLRGAFSKLDTAAPSADAMRMEKSP